MEQQKLTPGVIRGGGHELQPWRGSLANIFEGVGALGGEAWGGRAWRVCSQRMQAWSIEDPGPCEAAGLARRHAPLPFIDTPAPHAVSVWEEGEAV